jgi:hypothetical protein
MSQDLTSVEQHELAQAEQALPNNENNSEQ